jgi:hypothetical protein
MKAPALLRAGFAALLASCAAALPAPVTFQVNMSAQTALGNFNPASDALFVAGDPLNAWSTSDSPLAPSAGDASIWTGTFDAGGNPGDTGQYKFLMTASSGTTWEGSVGTGGTTGNRTFTVSDTAQTLPVVYFNNVTNSTSVSTDVTFQVNMSVQISLGNFDPGSGTVTVAGEFNGWSATAFELTNSVSDSNLWVGTLKLTGAVDTVVSYKFVMNGSTWEGNVGPNGAQNRSLTLKSTAQTLPVVFFNNLTALPTLIPVTFQVDMAVQIAQGKFDPAAGTVSVAGDLLNNWNTSASMLTLSSTTPYVWAGTFDISSSEGGVMLFKYVLNDGATWESMADNRSYTFPSTAAQTLPLVHFSNVNNLGSLTVGSVSGGQINLSWTAGPQIRLQRAADVGHSSWQDVPNTLGQASATVPAGSGPSYFQLVGP